MGLDKSYKGVYKLKTPGKYVGDPNSVVYRSLWERKLCEYFDTNSSIIQWSIEPFAIPYINAMDGSRHKYWIDFWVKIKDKNGKITEKLIEVKPSKLTLPPEKTNKPTKSYIKEVELWITNTSKWKAAKKLCEQKNWEFLIITEKNLFGKK